MPRSLKRCRLSSTSSGSAMSQKGCAQIATPPASWIASIASRDRRRLAQPERRLALDQVAADQRADVVDALVLQPLGVGGSAQHGARRGAGGRSVCRRRSALRSRLRRGRNRPRAARRASAACASRGRPGTPRGASSSAAPCGRSGSRGCAVRAGSPRPRPRPRSRPRARPSRRARRPPRIASETPEIVSWSESARSSTPASAARATTSLAESTPSEFVECDCRSKRGGTARKRM